MTEPIDLDAIERDAKSSWRYLPTCEVVLEMVAELRAHREEREKRSACLGDQDLLDLECEIAHNLTDDDGKLWARFKEELLQHREAMATWRALVVLCDPPGGVLGVLDRPRGSDCRFHEKVASARAKLEELEGK